MWGIKGIFLEVCRVFKFQVQKVEHNFCAIKLTFKNPFILRNRKLSFLVLSGHLNQVSSVFNQFKVQLLLLVLLLPCLWGSMLVQMGLTEHPDTGGHVWVLRTSLIFWRGDPASVTVEARLKHDSALVHSHGLLWSHCLGPRPGVCPATSLRASQQAALFLVFYPVALLGGFFHVLVAFLTHSQTTYSSQGPLPHHFCTLGKPEGGAGSGAQPSRAQISRAPIYIPTLHCCVLGSSSKTEFFQIQWENWIQVSSSWALLT